MSLEPMYDFVIVGAGAAGCVLARRLGASGFSVALLEAGRYVDPSRKDVSMVAMSDRILRQGGEMVESNKTVEQPALKGRKLDVAAGCAVGGSTQLNMAIWLRGSKLDYENEARVSGADWLRFPSMLPYFCKSETYHYSTDSPEGVDPASHGTEGFIHVSGNSAASRKYRIRGRVIEALKSAGLQWTSDINDGDTADRFGEMPSSAWFPLGGRMAASKYLVEDVAGVDLTCGAVVDRVLFEGSKAIGVLTTDIKTYNASKEVIICAGALSSPAILQRSGVGPASLLESLGVPIIKDLPGAGRNLWDHPMVFRRWQVNSPEVDNITHLLKAPERLKEELILYAKDGTGLLGGLPWDFVAFKNFSTQIRDVVEADESLYTEDKAYLVNPKASHIQLMVIYGYAGAANPNDNANISICLLVDTPTSRGSVAIDSTDPVTKPNVDVGWLKTDVDKELMRLGMRYAVEIMHAEGFRDIVEKELGPAADHPTETEQGLDDLIAEEVVTGWHYAGTCAMAPEDSKSVLGVVDSECRVYGVERLRVIDASVFPVPIAANTQAPTYGLAECMAERIMSAYAV